MSAPIQEQEEEVIGRAPAPEEAEAFEWVAGIGRNETTLLHEGLRQLVTLTSALLGGAALLLNQLEVSRGFKVAVFAPLLLALAVALYGTLPYRSAFDPNIYEEVLAFRKRGIAHKTCLLWASAILLLAAFTAFLVAMLFG